MRLPPVIHVVLRKNLISIFFQGRQLRGDMRTGFLIKLFTNVRIADSSVAIKEEMQIKKKKIACSLFIFIKENLPHVQKESFVLLSNLAGSWSRGHFNDSLSAHYGEHDGTLTNIINPTINQATNITKRKTPGKNDPWNPELI